MLQDPHLEEVFVDRESDRREVLTFCENRGTDTPRFLLIRCKTGCGITFFLKHIKSSVSGKALTIYADVENLGSQQIIETFFLEQSKHRLDFFLAGLDWRKVVAALLKAVANLSIPISIFQPAMAAGTDIVKPLIFTPFESQPLERLSRAVRSPIRKQNILFLLDNAQADFAAIEGLLRMMHAEEYNRVKFIIAYASDSGSDDAYLEFRERLFACGVASTEWNLAGITPEFVTAIANVRGLNLSEAEVENLAGGSRSNIWSLLSLLRKGPPREQSLSPLETHILRLLIVAGQPVRRSDLWALSAASPLVHASGEVEWIGALDRLVSRRIVSIMEHELADGSVALATGAQPEVATLVADNVGNLPVLQEVYDYFDRADQAISPRHSITYTAPLLYRIAKLIDPVRIPARAQKLVDAALAQGSLKDAQKYIDEACKGGAASLHEHYLQISFYVACLDFEKALAIINSLGDVTVRRYRILVLLRAVALNRVRNHDDSIREIDHLLESENVSSHELSVLASYKISGLLHEGREKEAASFAVQVIPRLSRAKGFGYFLRNASAAFMWGERADLKTASSLLERSARIMRSAKDSFGEHTVYNNQGALACYRKDYKTGLKLFNEAYAGLRIYGTHHLEEVGVNIGSALIRVGEFEQARQHLLRYCAITGWDLPRCYAENALVLLEMLIGTHEEAVRRMTLLLERVHLIPLSDTQWRTNYNSAVLEAIREGPTQRLHAKLAILREVNWTNEAELSDVVDAANTGEVSREKMCQLWSLDYCQYWSQNPLAMLPKEFLSL